MVRTHIVLCLVSIVMSLAVMLSNVRAQDGRQLFNERRYIPQTTATPTPARTPESEPIPRGWIIGGVAAALLLGAGLLLAALKAWRSSNLFERNYHFPTAGPAALRFGGKRSGGLMAAVDFSRKEID
jgi:hypothetical protein